MLDVSIIIVNYNTLSVTSSCINSLFNATTRITFEVILVDNASTDGSKEFFKADSRIIYIYNEQNIGFGQANNKGLSIAKGRNIFFLNPDTLLLNNAVKILSDYLDANIEIGACGGNLYDEQMQCAHSYFMLLPSVRWELNWWSKGLLEKILWGRNSQFNHSGLPRKVGYICGADLMVKHSVLRQVGGFSPAFFMYYEETDLSYRIKKAGYTIYSVPGARIQHLEGKSFKKSLNTSRMLYLEKSLSTYHSLHTGIVRRKIIQVMRLLRLFVKYRIVSHKNCPNELYRERIRLILEKGV